MASEARSAWGVRYAFAGACLAALFAVSTAACSRADDKSAGKGRPPPLVAVAKVTARDVAVEVRAPVELRPLAQADVGSKTLGYIDAVLVDRGDAVKRGQTVALVRPSDLPDQLAAARGSLAQSQAAVALARTNAERAQKLAPTGVISQQELQQALSALVAAEAAQTGAQAQTQGLATRLGETRITSPLDGVVAARRLDPGALVGPPGGGAILTVVSIDTLRVFITVTERELTGIAVGREAHVELDAFPGRRFDGHVVRVAPTLDPTTRTLDAEVQIENTSRELRPGMFGRGSIVVAVHPHVPVIPARALQLVADKAYVFVVEGDKAVRRTITLGQDLGDDLEVLDGITEGDMLVTAGIDGLADGTVVRTAEGVDPYTGKSLPQEPEARARPDGGHAL